MTGQVFDFFANPELPTPTLGVDEVRRLMDETFGMECHVTELGSQQDQNFLVSGIADAAPIGVLKLSNPVFSEAEIELQDLAASTVAEREPALRVPQVVDGPRGLMSAWWNTSQGRIHARIITHVSGATLTGSGYLSPATVARMGELAAKVSVALADVRHPASNRVLQWDLRHAERVIATLAADEPDAEVRQYSCAVAESAQQCVDAVASRLPQQLGHFDITDDNVIGKPGALPDAVIDFGDVAESWAVNEIAVTVSSLLHHDGVDPADTLPAIRAFHSIRPLSEDEVDALWPLVALRGVVLALSGRQQVRLDAKNEYASSALEREFLVLRQAASVPFEVMGECIRRALGFAPRRRPVWTAAALVGGLADAVILDAGTTSPLNDEGRWLDQGALDDAALAALDGGAPATVAPAWLPRLTGAPARTPGVPATVPTALTLWLAEDTTVTVPADGRLEPTDGGFTIVTGEHAVRFTGIAGTPRDRGHLPARTAVDVQLTRADSGEVPLLVQPAYAAGWQILAGDPGPTLGLAETVVEDDDTLALRERVLADVQEHYYARPPRIERGWREFLADVDGRVYLDMVNNVASVGHAHPRVVEAANRQMRLLNTNSRFNYRVIAEFADRISATLPDELDTVFFVNSGSEATDLAIRIAMAATGRTDIVAMREAYHGWTYASDAVSTSIADNPNALATRPDWVHTVDAANSYRGVHRGDDAVRYATDAVRVIDDLVASGTPLAGFICESYFGNAGGVALPEGYLAQVYAAVRRHGGLAIADEVQVGYGRLGEWFWGFQQQQAVPDVVAVAKSVGSGQPIGVVVTRRDIAERYRTGGYFFSSTGGSPVSSAIGMAVLDVIEQEGLQENARVVGAHLKARLLGLADEHPIIGTVHGSGLYLGLELVRDRVTLEPATEETAAICDRLLTLGVVMQPTGDFLNVFKIKPPLCVSKESADYFVDSLERVLTTGW